MKSLKIYLLERLHDIIEQAKELSDLRKLADAKSYVIITHLAKIYLNFDPLYNAKHSREMAAEIMKLIKVKTKAIGKPIKPTKLLFDMWLPNDPKKYDRDTLNSIATAEMPRRYDRNIINKLRDSDFGDRCMKLLFWLDDQNVYRITRFDVEDKIIEIFDIHNQ